MAVLMLGNVFIVLCCRGVHGIRRRSNREKLKGWVKLIWVHLVSPFSAAFCGCDLFVVEDTVVVHHLIPCLSNSFSRSKT